MMSTIYSTICVLFLASVISAAPIDSGSQNIYSGFFINERKSSVECYIIYTKPSGDSLKGDVFTIDEEDDYLVGEHLIFDKTQAGYAVMKEIHCDKLELKAPFIGVEPFKKSAKFYIKEDKIVAGRSM